MVPIFICITLGIAKIGGASYTISNSNTFYNLDFNGNFD